MQQLVKEHSMVSIFDKMSDADRISDLHSPELAGNMGEVIVVAPNDFMIVIKH